MSIEHFVAQSRDADLVKEIGAFRRLPLFDLLKLRAIPLLADGVTQILPL